ncbi:hypothetical protein ACFTZB_13775, partial [Rhodococcus sp. NPDC057014]|uniref:hypothetical protein n=1 Tax=Rhodococcus sp. NPDC057014 TaxID=3346000 RepID=UPI003626D6DE
ENPCAGGTGPSKGPVRMVADRNCHQLCMSCIPWCRRSPTTTKTSNSPAAKAARRIIQESWYIRIPSCRAGSGYTDAGER